MKIRNAFKLTSVFVLFAVLVLSSGCKKSKRTVTEKPFEPSLATETKATIKVVGNYSNFEALEAEFDRFNQIYPNVELTYSYLDNYKSVIMPSLNSDEPPDIYFIFSWMWGNTKYDPLFETAENLASSELNINLNCIEEGNLFKTSGGKIPMLPMFSQGYGMLVNEDLFKKENLSIPTTFQELLDICQKLKAAGYQSPLMGYNKIDSGWYASISYPYAHYLVKDNKEAIDAINNSEPGAGKYMRPLYEVIDELVKKGCIDPDYCSAQISDNYNKVILRFFEGDVPMMLVVSDVVSGTKKRESKSEAFTASPFKYRLYPTPITDKSGIFISNTGTGFAVNSNSKQLEMTNEFIRFLTQTAELNNLANVKHLIPITKDFSSDELFAPMENGIKIYANTTILLDDIQKKLRTNCYNIANKTMTVEQAVNN